MINGGGERKEAEGTGEQAETGERDKEDTPEGPEQ